MTALLLAAAFVLIIAGALAFTNAVEWLGVRLNLGHGAVGALLAAVGTALPESFIPVVALVGGGPEETQIAIGAIIGAPFMLATVAMLLVSVAALGFRRRRENDRRVEPDRRGARRDLLVFLACLPVAAALGLGSAPWLRVAGAVLLVVAYVAYAYRTVRAAGAGEDEEELTALFFDPSRHDPPRTWQIVVQFLLALAAIVGGAELFVTEVEQIAKSLGVEPLVLALVLAPLTTELPEKANSVLWIRDGKDTLAVGNITGAMVFQATLPVTLGLLLTDWKLEAPALVAIALAGAGAVVALWAIGRESFAPWPALAWSALFGTLLVVLVA